MEVWSCASAGISHQSDLVPTLDTLARSYQPLLQVAIPSNNTVFVVHHEYLAKAPFIANKCDYAVGRRNNVCTLARSDIKPLVKFSQAGERG